MEIALSAETIGHIGPLPITNTILVTWLTTILLTILAVLATRKVEKVPSGLQNFFEFVIEGAYGLIEDLAHNKAKVFFPLLMTFFLFIITANWLGLLPGFGTIGFYETAHEESATGTKHEEYVEAPPALEAIPGEHAAIPALETTVHEENVVPKETESPTENKQEEKIFVPLFRSINADLNTTLALALVSVLTTHFFSVKFLGIKNYLQHWFSLNPIFLFVGLLELVGEVTKVVSLSFRLFGNIFAGEVVLATIAGIFAFIAPLPFYFLEIIVGFVQAAVFMMLTLTFMVLLTEKHAEEHAD